MITNRQNRINSSIQKPAKPNNDPETQEQAIKRLQEQVNTLECVSKITSLAVIRICEELDKLGQQREDNPAARNHRQVN
jgi:hypothetical protein